MDQASLIRATLEKTWAEVRPRMETALIEQLAVAPANTNSIQSMNQAARWLDQAENETQWRMALVQAAGKFADRAALFLIESGNLKCVALHGVESETLPGQLIPILQAPAFHTAIETGEPVVALRRPADISEPIAAVFHHPGIKKSYLLPMRAAGMTIAVLYTEGATVQLSALELLVRLAGNASQPIPDQWKSLNRDDQHLHLKAQRFARVAIARLLLNRPLDVRAGRRRKAVYSSLHTDIDKIRTQFADQFFAKSRNMVDYLHIEIVARLSNDDITLLGAEYPGQMH